MADPKTFSKQTIIASADEDAIQIKNSVGTVVGWIDSTGTGQGSLASGSGIPGGSTGELQFNDTGTFGGVKSTYDATPGAEVLSLRSNVIVEPTNIGGLSVQPIVDSSTFGATGLYAQSQITGGGPHNNIQLYVDTPAVLGGTVGQSNGLFIDDQNPGNSSSDAAAILIADQTAPGKALKTGVGPVEFGETPTAPTQTKDNNSTSLATTAYVKSQGAPLWRKVLTSPDTGMQQGYTTDGYYHYMFTTNAVYKLNPDWSVAASNLTPFSGLGAYNHLGDGVFFNGNLYVAAENYGGCGSVSLQSIFVFNATTLARTAVQDVSAYQNEISSVTYAADVGASGALIASSFCDNTKLFKYDPGTLAHIGDITLSAPLNQIQGVTYRSGSANPTLGNGLIYVVTDDNDSISAVDLSGNVLGTVLSQAGLLESEGLEFGCTVNGPIVYELRWLQVQEDGTKRVVFYAPERQANRVEVSDGDIQQGVFVGDVYNSAGAANAVGFVCRRARGTLDNPQTPLANDILGGWFGKSYLGSPSGFSNNLAAIRIGCDENHDSSHGGTFIDFATTSNGAVGRTVRMKLRNSGVLNFTSVPVFANNTAALAGGLLAGDVYRTGADPDPLCIVH